MRNEAKLFILSKLKGNETVKLRRSAKIVSTLNLKYLTYLFMFKLVFLSNSGIFFIHVTIFIKKKRIRYLIKKNDDGQKNVLFLENKFNKNAYINREKRQK